MAHKEILKYQKYKSSSSIPEREIPASFDLRNISGVNYAGEVRNQEGCAASSSHSFIQVVENRLRMQHGVTIIPNLSVQQLISCNYMNEGCEGGWSIFNGFFAENIGLFA